MSKTIDRKTTAKTGITLNLLSHGKLELPEQIIQLVGSHYREPMEQMFQAMWTRFLNNKSKTSSVYWYDKFNNEEVFNSFLIHLNNAGWATTTTQPNRNWSDTELNEKKILELVSREQLSSIREFYKFNSLKLTKSISTKYDVTKLLGKKTNTGIKRPGFAKAGNSEFTYDTEIIKANRDAIELNLTKSMRELGLDLTDFDDNADYASVSKAILDFHIENPFEVFTTGSNINDSRGRAISAALAKVFNPISCKDARACLIIDDKRDFNDSHLSSVYLFIAELVGNKQQTIEAKELEGIRCFKEEVYEELDLITHIMDTEEAQKEENKRANEDRKELH